MINQNSTLPRTETPVGLLPEDDRVVSPAQVAEAAKLERYASTKTKTSELSHDMGGAILTFGLSDLNGERLPTDHQIAEHATPDQPA